MTAMETEFTTWLKKAMERRGVIQAQVAAYCNVSTAAVSRWSTGKSRPDPEYCRRLAEYFNESLGKVYTLAGHPAPSEYAIPERQPVSLNEARVDFLSRLPLEIPVVEQFASAGEGQAVLDYVYLAPARTTSRNLIGVRVRGQSMEPDILDGDTVIIDPELEAKPGHVVVASVGDSVYVKRLERRSGHNVLAGNNGAISAEEATIQGVVIQTIHDVPH